MHRFTMPQIQEWSHILILKACPRYMCPRWGNYLGRGHLRHVPDIRDMFLISVSQIRKLSGTRPSGTCPWYMYPWWGVLPGTCPHNDLPKIVAKKLFIASNAKSSVCAVYKSHGSTALAVRHASEGPEMLVPFSDSIPSVCASITNSRYCNLQLH